MKLGYNSSFIFYNHTLLGIYLGRMSREEHKYGIFPILEVFGVNRYAMPGTGRRMSSVFPENNLVYFTTEIPAPSAVLMFNKNDWELQSWHRSKKRTFNKAVQYIWPEVTKDRHLFRNQITSGWSSKDFGIVCDGLIAISNLHEIHISMQNKDVCFTYNDSLLDFAEIEKPSKVLLSNGFSILIASRIPNAIRNEWVDKDKKEDVLRAATELTGVEAELNETLNTINRPRLDWVCNLEPKWKDKSKQIVQFYSPDRRETYSAEEVLTEIRINKISKEKEISIWQKWLGDDPTEKKRLQAIIEMIKNRP